MHSNSLLLLGLQNCVRKYKITDYFVKEDSPVFILVIQQVSRLYGLLAGELPQLLVGDVFIQQAHDHL